MDIRIQAIGLNDKGNQTHVLGYTLENERLLNQKPFIFGVSSR